jgi:glucose-1-phosphate adenylyltransferase
MKGEHGEWFSGTANAIYQNIDYISGYNPDYVLILSGDHIYQMDYSDMLAFHKKNKCDVTIAALEVGWDEASRFGLMNTRDDARIYEFEEKPANPKSNMANMGIYIFSWPVLHDALIRDNKVHPDSDFGKHVLPMLLSEDKRMFAYPFNGYWKDVGTIDSYWVANMDLVKTLPDFNLYEDFKKIYTDADHQPPMYSGPESEVRSSLLSEGCEVMGRVIGSVLGPNVVIEEGATVRDSIVMENCVIGRNAIIDKVIIDENCTVGESVIIGEGDCVPNTDKPKIYDTGITVLGEYTVIPNKVSIGKNCVIHGTTYEADYPGGRLESGQSIYKALSK